MRFDAFTSEFKISKGKAIWTGPGLPEIAIFIASSISSLMLSAFSILILFLTKPFAIFICCNS